MQNLGLTEDDPANPFIFQVFIRRSRRGADLLDAEMRARCVAEGRINYRLHAVDEEARMATSVVYYMKVNQYVKIGTAVDLNSRLSAYPPGTQVLATEPGSYELETKRLRQFSEYLAARREWFHPGPRLMQYIEGLRAARLAKPS